MDDTLEKAVKVANFMATLTSQRKLALEEFNQATIYYFNGASFTITPTLISFVNTLLTKFESAVLIDDNNIPVPIDDLPKFLESIIHIYFEAANKYAVVYSDLKSKRKVEDLVKL